MSTRTGNCLQSRRCTCRLAAARPRVIPTRPSLLHRLRTWWLARPHRQDHSDAVAELAEIQREFADWLAWALSAQIEEVPGPAAMNARIDRFNRQELEQEDKRDRALAALNALGVEP